MLNLQALRDQRLRTDPYPYIVVPGFVQGANLDAALRDFPDIQHPGSIPAAELSGGPAYQQLLAELEGPELRATLADVFGTDLSDFPTMTTLRGVMREKDGRIHTDSRTKIITVLLYLNQDWSDQSGNLRVLRNGHDIEDYVEEIPPEAGTLMVFRVTDNCWHGHKPVVGRRLSVQMNYLIGDAARGKHQFFHRLSARLKKLRGGPRSSAV